MVHRGVDERNPLPFRSACFLHDILRRKVGLGDTWAENTLVVVSRDKRGTLVKYCLHGALHGALRARESLLACQTRQAPGRVSRVRSPVKVRSKWHGRQKSRHMTQEPDLVYAPMRRLPQIKASQDGHGHTWPYIILLLEVRMALLTLMPGCTCSWL